MNLQRDASNALNCAAALHNIQLHCPALAPILINTCREASDLVLIILSEEGPTQGDLLAMPIYANSTIPSIRKLPAEVQQLWYADDGSACDGIAALCC